MSNIKISFAQIDEFIPEKVFNSIANENKHKHKFLINYNKSIIKTKIINFSDFENRVEIDIKTYNDSLPIHLVFFIIYQKEINYNTINRYKYSLRFNTTQIELKQESIQKLLDNVEQALN